MLAGEYRQRDSVWVGGWLAGCSREELIVQLLTVARRFLLMLPLKQPPALASHPPVLSSIPHHDNEHALYFAPTIQRLLLLVLPAKSTLDCQSINAFLCTSFL